MKLNDDKVMAVLDNMVTQIDMAIDELLEEDTPAIKKAEAILLNVSMELDILVDRLTEDDE